MNTNIRGATIDDLGEISRLNQALFIYETAFNNEYNLGWTYSEDGQNYFKKMIEDDKQIALVAEVENTIVGYIVASIYHFSFRKDNPIAELENMYVEEQYRGQGVGKKLVEQAKKYAKEKGAKRMKVEAAAPNEKAIAFYRSCGFADFDLILQTKLD